MKLGTPEHPKHIHLRSVLGTGAAETSGLLEHTWHFAAAFAYRGDIGRWPDEAIEHAAGWAGEPGRMIEAMVECRWLDRHPVHRLVVHDWHDHCWEFIHKRIQRAQKRHAGGKGPPEPGFASLRGKFDPERVGASLDSGGQRQTVADNGGLSLPCPSMSCHSSPDLAPGQVRSGEDISSDASSDAKGGSTLAEAVCHCIDIIEKNRPRKAEVADASPGGPAFDYVHKRPK
ncbi:MAG TPA: hypothetical protein VMY87_06170 [Armatimonadota bacterium]|nr:hypothetical protein [Armatimonadota bacterium]